MIIFGLASSAESSRSEPLATELATLMVQRNLNAFAAKDPDAADMFVAALLFPNVQLLVVSGQPTTPRAAQTELDQKQYTEVYTTLQTAVVAASQIFFQDLKADGLHARAEAVDVECEHVANQTVFDGNPGKHHLTESQYSEKFTAADLAYSRLLSILVASLKQQPLIAAAKP
jgi:hypothetical protein